MHPEYDRDTTNNDIALVKLNQTVRFSRTIQPACLPEYGEYVKEGQTAIVAGWGSMQGECGRLVIRYQLINTYRLSAPVITSLSLIIRSVITKHISDYHLITDKLLAPNTGIVDPKCYFIQVSGS